MEKEIAALGALVLLTLVQTLVLMLTRKKVHDICPFCGCKGKD